MNSDEFWKKYTRASNHLIWADLVQYLLPFVTLYFSNTSPCDHVQTIHPN